MNSKDRRVPVLVLLASVAVLGLLWVTKKRPEKKILTTKPPRVDVVRARRSTDPISVIGQGRVTPGKRIELRSEVSGVVKWVDDDFLPGGVFQKQAMLVEVDPREYRVQVAQEKSQVLQAEVEIELEQSRGRIAERELEMLKSLDSAETSTLSEQGLVLRKPQLESAEAKLAAARSGLSQARLRLSKTALRAPFNLVVVEKSVDRGQYVTPQNVLAILVGTDQFFVEASFPVSALPYLKARSQKDPGSKAQVVVRLGENREWSFEGEVTKVLSHLEEQGRRLQALISVPDPLSLREGSKKKLLLESYVKVEVEALLAGPTFVIPRAGLRPDNQIWLVDEEDTLLVRRVEVGFKNRDSVFITQGLAEGERVVVSRLAAAVPKMKLRVSDNKVEVRPRARKNPE